MTYSISVKPEALMVMDPRTLIEFFEKEVNLSVPDSIDTPEERKKAIETMNLAAGYVCYFKSMEITARALKREAKAKKAKDDAEHYLGCEEVFHLYAEVSEKMYDSVIRMMTMKKIEQEEDKKTSRTV